MIFRSQAAASQMATLSQVAQQATTVHATGEQAVRNAGGVQTMAGAAAIGAAAGMLVCGPIVGLAVAAGAAYAATRTDAVGDAARTAGQGVVTVTRKVDEINQEHKITGATGCWGASSSSAAAAAAATCKAQLRISKADHTHSPCVHAGISRPACRREGNGGGQGGVSKSQGD